MRISMLCVMLLSLVFCGCWGSGKADPALMTKLNEISTEVGSVKTEVGTVKTELGQVKAKQNDQGQLVLGLADKVNNLKMEVDPNSDLGRALIQSATDIAEIKARPTNPAPVAAAVSSTKDDLKQAMKEIADEKKAEKKAAEDEKKRQAKARQDRINEQREALKPLLDEMKGMKKDVDKLKKQPPIVVPLADNPKVCLMREDPPVSFLICNKRYFIPSIPRDPILCASPAAIHAAVQHRLAIRRSTASSVGPGANIGR